MADLLSGESAQPIPFNFGDRAVRVIVRDGEPWFVASDVCAALGYKNSSQTVADHLDDDERYIVSIDRGGKLTIINESGLYALVLRSHKPEARKFARWVTGEVLPAIRKTGRYEKPGRELTVNQMVAKLAEQVSVPNGHPVELFMPLVDAVNAKMGKRADYMPSLRMRRWLVSFDHEGREQVTCVPPDSMVTSMENLPAMLRDPGALVDAADLLRIATSCLCELTRRAQMRVP